MRQINCIHPPVYTKHLQKVCTALERAMSSASKTQRCFLDLLTNITFLNVMKIKSSNRGTQNTAALREVPSKVAFVIKSGELARQYQEMLLSTPFPSSYFCHIILKKSHIVFGFLSIRWAILVMGKSLTMTKTIMVGIAESELRESFSRKLLTTLSQTANWIRFLRLDSKGIQIASFQFVVTNFLKTSWLCLFQAEQ